MKLTLGFSPCPNDTFIFDALVNQKIDTGDLEFEVMLEDVQTLNQWAKEGKLDISKISYGVTPKITDSYVVLNSGGALGKGVGPLLISKNDVQGTKDEYSWQEIQDVVNASTIAVPGEDTTAHFLFSQAFPQATQKVFKRFDEIEAFVSCGEGLGVIIHENRFTYQEKGLHKIIDLGDYWEQTTGNPIPLGGIVMKRSFDAALIQRVDALIHESLQYAFAHYPAVTEYVRCHAQEMSEDVMRQHINLYVNNYSLNLGDAGKAAVLQMMETLGGKPYPPQTVFAQQ
ncbi:1,4-dihydroxy-6-naphthoate synthase [Phnomibacter sp. MR]|uniref:1,4-dihydroxy-6-naphthoate synthase n=1 Tax=Phnomibacter sp. MR TaxID=3042318 RepID=UPI003A806759